MTRDEELFPTPEDFIPDRFDVTVDEAVRDARDPRQCVHSFNRKRWSHLTRWHILRWIFGFGRRWVLVLWRYCGDVVEML